MTEAEDAALLRRAKSGEPRAFEALVKRHHRHLYFLILNLIHNHDDADELCQETFLRALEGLERFKGLSSFRTWLFRIGVNLALDLLRKRRRRVVLKKALAVKKRRSAPDAAISLEAAEVKTLVDEALKALPPKQKAAFVLVVLGGLNYQEAAEALGVNRGTLGWLLHKARIALRKKLRPIIQD